MDVKGTVKKAERWRIDAFELWCWRRPLRVPWPARRSNQSILKEINPEYSPYYWERLKVGGEEDDRGWDGWMVSLTSWHEFEQDPGVGERQRSLACYSPWGCKESDMADRLNWTYPMANASCNCHVSPAVWGSPKPQHISLVSLHPCTEVTA